MPDLTPLINKANLTGLVLLLMASLTGKSLALDPDGAPAQDELHSPTSVDEIARQINQQPQWRILAAEPVVEDRKIMYQFKLLNKERGRVEVIVIDPDKPELDQFNPTSPTSN